MNKFLAVSLVACGLLHGAGFKIPEQSSDSVALLNSNIATSFGPDASYLNPANMMFLDSPMHYFEASLTYLQLDNVKYTHNNGTKYKSRKSKAVVPTIHFVSPERVENWRFGLSIVVPAGMAMRWDEDLPKATSKKFDLKVLELNPTAAYRFSDSFAIGFGLRAVYTQGKAIQEVTSPMNASQDIKGDGVNFGYNVALTYKPIENLSLAATYRSKVDMKLKGDSDIVAPAHPLGAFLNGSYSGKARLNVPLPATLNLALSYRFTDTTFLFNYEKTYWSAWKALDFEYPGANSTNSTNPFFNAFDEPKKRNWKDTDTYRLGVAHNATKKLRLMGSVTFDEAASGSDTTSFDLPDTKAVIYGAGFNYKLSETLEIAASYFYQDRKKREVQYYSGNPNYPNGTFERGNAQAINLSMKYKF